MGIDFYTRNTRVNVSTYEVDGLMNLLSRLDISTDWMHRDYELYQMEGLIRQLVLVKTAVIRKHKSEERSLYIEQLDDIIDFVRYCQKNRMSFKHSY